MNPRVLLLVVVASTWLRLLPPGWGEKRPPADAAHLQMPAALAHGSRSTYPQGKIDLHVRVSPSPSRLGQRLTYLAYAYVEYGGRLKFTRPEAGGDFTWGDVRVGRKTVTRLEYGVQPYAADSVWMEIPLQVFRVGLVSIPGPAVRVRDTFTTRLPTARVFVMPTVTASDSAATLRPLHGPLGAPWWERVPWRIVAAVAAVLALLFALVAWARRRRRKVLPAAVPAAAARPAIDPTAEALAALAALRKQGLPAQGRFGEHALALTRILRRYLERTLGTPRPGDTSPELLARLRTSRLAPEDVSRLEGLLGLWDRVKFARAPLDPGEAQRCEAAVEALVSRRESPREVA